MIPALRSKRIVHKVDSRVRRHAIMLGGHLVPRGRFQRIFVGRTYLVTGAVTHNLSLVNPDRSGSYLVDNTQIVAGKKNDLGSTD